MRTTKTYERYTVEAARPPLEGFNVYGWGTYPAHSVLAGQPSKTFLDNYGTIELARGEYPEAEQSSRWLDPQVSLNHLPGEDDPVAGGMYPDDIGDDDYDGSSQEVDRG